MLDVGYAGGGMATPETNVRASGVFCCRDQSIAKKGHAQHQRISDQEYPIPQQPAVETKPSDAIVCPTNNHFYTPCDIQVHAIASRPTAGNNHQQMMAALHPINSVVIGSQ